MRKFLATLCFVLGIAAAASAQDFRPVGSDLTTVLQDIGQNVINNMQQTLLSDDGIGAASMGKSHFYIGFSVGASLTHGLLGFVDDTSQFTTLNVPALLNTYLPSSFSSYYDTLKTFFPEPDLKLTLGFKPGWAGLEFLGTFSIIPQALTGALAGSGGSSLSGLELNSLSAGLRVRKVLIEDSGAWPALSIGVGYTYANFNLGYPLPAFSQNISGTTMTINGTLSMATVMQSAGIDIDISKKLFIFVPYLKLMPWYQYSTYNGQIKDFQMTFSSGTGQLVPSAPSSSITVSNVNFLLAGGVEIALGGFILTPNASYNILTNTFAVDLSMRGQF